jgi:hypothetical protein
VPTVRRPDLDSAKWALFNEAFARVAARSGSRSLAAHDLEQKLISGALPSAVRILRNGEEERKLLPRTFWHKGMLLDRTMGPGVQVRLAGPVTGSWYFFVRRAALDQFYPESIPTHVSHEKPPRRRTGPINKHDWHTIDGEIARRCIDKSGRLNVPDNENKIAEAVASQLACDGLDAPEMSHLREAVRRVCAVLRRDR